MHRNAGNACVSGKGKLASPSKTYPIFVPPLFDPVIVTFKFYITQMYQTRVNGNHRDLIQIQSNFLHALQISLFTRKDGITRNFI